MTRLPLCRDELACLHWSYAVMRPPKTTARCGPDSPATARHGEVSTDTPAPGPAVAMNSSDACWAG